MKKIGNQFSVVGILMILLLTTGCASLGPAFEQVASMPNGKALIYVYRPSAFVGGGVSYDININKKVIAPLRNGGYFPYFADPGKTEVWAKTEVRRSVVFVAEAGDTYYVKGGIMMGILVGRPHLEIVDATIAKTEIAGTKRITLFTKEDLAKRKAMEEED